MRRVMMLLTAMVVTVPLFAAAAYAATITGTAQGEFLVESNLDDTILGRGGGDEIRADLCFEPCGSLNDTDEVKAGNGDDLVVTADFDTKDVANGGDGDDFCLVDEGDVTRNCEEVQFGPIVSISASSGASQSELPSGLQFVNPAQ